MKLSSLIEIESNVPVPAAASRLGAALFGASSVRSTLPVELKSDDLRIALGETVVAFKASPDSSVAGGVRALVFAVDDARAAAEEVRDFGIVVSDCFDSHWENGAACQIALLDTQPILGFEIILIDGVPVRPDELHPDLRPTADLSPIFQVEPVVPSADRAVDLVERLFGGRVVESEFSAKLEKIAPAQRIRHVLLGDTVVQLIEMTQVLPGFSWSDLEQERGAAVHNLTFMVRDMPATKAAFEREGIDLIIAADLPWSEMIGAGNAKAGGEPFCVARTGKELGFHLELCVPFTDRVLGLLHRPIWGIG